MRVGKTVFLFGGVLESDAYGFDNLNREWSVEMKISIEYCTAWNYKPRASGLGAELQEKLGAEIELIASAGGVYEVVVDGRNIFSKKVFSTLL